MRIGSSLVAIGLGAAAYNYARKNNMMSRRSINRARKIVKSYL
ncbi:MULTISPECIES: YrzQ family protein [Bacillaceae]|uniref:YrzQ family protein n=1 Tax=Ectobacillus funiculus TaxID=137993 RepID=A0ABV5WKI1_9BACI|nr:YrzQ family protein [Ectobacillus funiculus]